MPTGVPGSHTPQRRFRAPDPLYNAAKAKAHAQGRPLAVVLRLLLERWVEEGGDGPLER